MEHLWKAFKARAIIREMFDMRGYRVEDVEPWETEFGEFKSFYRNVHSFLDVTMAAWKNETRLVLVFFPLEETLKTENLKTIFDFAKERNCNHIIITFKDTITSFARKIMMSQACRVETFSIGNLQYNIMKHEWVFPHRLLSEEEATAVLKKHMLKRENLDKIIVNVDNVAKFLGMRTNDIVEIERTSLEGVRSKAYRVGVRGTK